MTTLIIASALLAVITTLLYFYCIKLEGECNQLREALAAKPVGSRPRTETVFATADLRSDSDNPEKAARKRLCSSLGYFMIRKFPTYVKELTAEDGTHYLKVSFDVTPNEVTE